MTITLTTFLSHLDNLVPDGSTELEKHQRFHFIKQAVSQYAQDQPEGDQVDDISGDGGRYYDLASLASAWVEGFSRIVSIEYPAQAIGDDATPIYLDSGDWDDSYFQGGVRYLFFPNHAPASGETMRVRYTTSYTWSAGTITVAVSKAAHGFSLNDYIYQDEQLAWQAADQALLATHQATTITDVDNFTASELVTTVPTGDFFAVCDLAACKSCLAIAAKYSRTSDPTIAADSAGHTTRAQEFRAQANRYCQSYSTHLGLATDGSGAVRERGASDVVDYDTEPGWPSGRRFLFHGNEVR